MRKLIIDTELLIDAACGLADTLAFFSKCNDDLAISIITIAQIHACFRNVREEERIMAFCESFEQIELNKEIAVLAGRFRGKYGKNGITMADCLIAATAVRADATLVTLDKKKFPMLDRVLVPYQKV